MFDHNNCKCCESLQIIQEQSFHKKAIVREKLEAKTNQKKKAN